MNGSGNVNKKITCKIDENDGIIFFGNNCTLALKKYRKNKKLIEERNRGILSVFKLTNIYKKFNANSSQEYPWPFPNKNGILVFLDPEDQFAMYFNGISPHSIQILNANNLPIFTSPQPYIGITTHFCNVSFLDFF